MTKSHNRRSVRLNDYDYTQTGAYFVTICTHQRAYLFGEVVDGNMIANRFGEVVQGEWNQTAILRPYVELDAFVIMPNHIHGIIVIVNENTDGGRGMVHHDPTKREFSKPIAHSLATIVGAFKGAVTRHINRLIDPPDKPIWQRNYYEHIIRNELDLSRIREYILYNPARWSEDSLYAG